VQSDQLAHLSEPVRDCLLKAVSLCKSSQSAPRSQADVDSMLQLLGLDPPSALSCLTQMYAPTASQHPPSMPHNFDNTASTMPNLSTGLPASLPPGLSSSLAGGAGATGGLNGHAFGNSAGVPSPQAISSSFLQQAQLPREIGTAVSAASSAAGRTSISQMSQLRALVEEPATLAGPPLMRRNLTPEEQLASLLASNHASGAPGTLPAMLPAQTDINAQSTSMADLNVQSVLGQLQSKDALNALFSGSVDAGAAVAAGGLVGPDGGNAVEGRCSPDPAASFPVQRLLDGVRDAWPSLPMQNTLLEEPRGHAGL
jgi:hypothetical protein